MGPGLGVPLVPQIARFTNGFAWRSPARNVHRLRSFARAELNTLIELEQAANLTRDPARAAAYLTHGADEARHARMFVAHARRIAKQHGLPAVTAPRTDTSSLFQTLDEPGFLAFMHHGEGRGLQQFTTYRDHLQATDPRGSAMFDAILADEARHEAYSHALLVELTPAGPALRRARLWEAWRTLRTVQRATATTLFAASFVGLWPVLALLGLWTRAVRPERRGWT